MTPDCLPAPPPPARVAPLSADSLVWHQIFWPVPFAEATAFGLLRHWAAQTHAPQLILEARAAASGVTYLVGCQLRHASAVRRAIEQLVPGSVVVAFLDDRPPVTVARQLKPTTGFRPLEPADAVASARSILHALTAVKAGEQLVIQHVLGPRVHPRLAPQEPPQYDQSTLSKVLFGVQPEKRADAKQALIQKLGSHGFLSTIRLGVEASSPERRRTLLLGLAAAIRTVAAPGVGVRLVGDDPAKLNRPRSSWPWLARGRRLTIIETARLSAWPVADAEDTAASYPGQPPRHPKPIRPSGAVVMPGPDSADRRTTLSRRLVAVANAPGTGGAIGYSVPDALRHTWVIGPSGVGKSTLLLNLIVQDLEANRPVVVIEPKDLVADVLARIPAHRVGDVVVLDPLDSAPVGINPLHRPLPRSGASSSSGERQPTPDGLLAASATASPTTLATPPTPGHGTTTSPDVVADALFGTFHGLYGEAIGPRSSDILRNSFEVLARRAAEHDDASLVMLPLLLSNPAFRRSVTQGVMQRDPFAAGPFWAWFDSLSPEGAAKVIAPLSNKVRPLLSPHLRTVLAQRDPRFNVRQVLTERKVLLVPLQKGVIGPEAAQLLAAVVLAELWQAIRERAAQPEDSRQPVMVYIDEVQEYLNLPTDLDDALATARSLKAGFHLAHQFEGQLPKRMADAFRNNARSRICFQLGAEDAKTMAAGQTVLSPEDFTSLPAHHIYARLMRDNTMQPWVSGTTLAPPPITSDPAEIRRLSRDTYGRAVAEIEAGFAELLDNLDGGAAAVRASVPHGQARGRRRS